MNIEIAKIDVSMDLYDVKTALALILHSDDYFPRRSEDEPLINFNLELQPHQTLQHNGRGKLTLPTRAIGDKLLRILTEMPADSRKRLLGSMMMRKMSVKPPDNVQQQLLKVPYEDPMVNKERDSKVYKMGVTWRINDLQIGQWLRRPKNGKNGVFAWEWGRNYTKIGVARLSIEYEHKEIRMTLGDPLVEDEAFSVVLKFTNIQNIWYGYEYSPFICFDLYTPAIFETESFNRSTTGYITADQKKFRKRISALDEAHRRISPYAYQIRITLFQDKPSDLEEFADLCEIAELRKPKSTEIVSEKRDLLSNKQLLAVQKCLEEYRSFPWTIRFQIENMLRRTLITTEVFLKQLHRPFLEVATMRPQDAGYILRNYMQKLALDNRDLDSSFTQHFQGFLCSQLAFPSSFSAFNLDDSIACHSVTFTPTRLLLEGPYASQSNRILRQYAEHQDQFLRVDFRDEDRLQYRWDRAVDGDPLVAERVGKTLKAGFTLAGRDFEFLGYSSSALRSHSTWFVSPFFHPQKGHVTAASIRREAGDFSKLLCYPAKFAARLAQALSGTAPSVTITKSQWEVVDDIAAGSPSKRRGSDHKEAQPGKEPSPHTDGVGTFSTELGNMIWNAYKKDSRRLDTKAEPDAYQMRFLGFKGVIARDPSLKGIKLCLRPSMKKFESHDVESAEIEIANAFHTPSPMNLHRSMVMILEDRGVTKEMFLSLLNAAVADIRLACDDLGELIRVLRAHKLGHHFGLISALQRLADAPFRLHLNPATPDRCLRSPFIDDLIRCAVGTILRELQYKCRIPVPDSWHLVGVADEGPSYIKRGICEEKELYTLKEGDIYVCIQKDKSSKPEYIKGMCHISRSPMYYPSDVQMVYAIGEPPARKKCAFSKLVNVVVFPSKGKRSFASRMSGGDLDGDTYSISRCSGLFLSKDAQDADFPTVDMLSIDPSLLEIQDPITGETRLEQEKAIPSVCDFVTEYINSDVLGMLSVNHLIMADQSSDGVYAEECLALARLCNEAVDYPRNGRRVDVSGMPRRLFPNKPDWQKGEVDTYGKRDFYRSDRAVGEIYRAVEKASGPVDIMDSSPPAVEAARHPIFMTLNPIVERALKGCSSEKLTTKDDVVRIFRPFEAELNYIATTHALSDKHRLSEAEIVIGTILAQCSQDRWRKERIYKMSLHVRKLENDMKDYVYKKKKRQELSRIELEQALEFAWTAWVMMTDSIAKNKLVVTQNTFALIMLNIAFECLEDLKCLL